MRHPRIILLFLVLVIPFTAYTQRSRRSEPRSQILEGVVVDTTGGPQWIGIVVESNGRRYVVSINNSRYPATDPTVIGGSVESVGTRVRVVFTKTEPWINNTIALVATRIIKLANQTITPRERKQTSIVQGGDWNSFWNAFRVAVRKRDRAALRRMMSSRFDSGGDGPYSPDAWIKLMDRNSFWPMTQRAVSSGTKPSRANDGRPIRVTKDMYLFFELGTDARWRWAGVVGD